MAGPTWTICLLDVPGESRCVANQIESTRVPLDFVGNYSEAEVVRLHAGLEAREMEDKWDVVYEAPWLHFHRSWTGFCI